jgi:uncharacterized protein YceH (UPF0502 family)
MVIETSGGRVSRYAHNIDRVLQVPAQSCALLTVLMLRGPQTAGELRIAFARLHRFADISSVEGFLDELAEREPPLVVKLGRSAGAREARWAHLLCGEVAAGTPMAVAAGEQSVSLGELAALKAEQTRLAAEVQTLKAQLSQLADELGVTLKAP